MGKINGRLLEAEGEAFVDMSSVDLSHYSSGHTYVFTDSEGYVMTGYIRGVQPKPKWHQKLWRHLAQLWYKFQTIIQRVIIERATKGKCERGRDD